MASVLIASTNAAVVTGLQEQLSSHDFSVTTSNDAESVMSLLSGNDATVDRSKLNQARAKLV